MVTKRHRYKNNHTRKNTLHKTDNIVFFDDDFTHNISPFRKSFPLMKSILVPTKKPYSQILKGKSALYYPIMFLKKYKDNKLAQERVNTMSSDKYSETGQGISISGIKKIIKWANIPSNKPRTILFDWDKTISVMNRVYLPKLHSNKYSADDAAHFFSGTLERFNALQNMFFELHKNNITYFIFTNNGWGHLVTGQEENFYFFLGIVKVLAPHITEKNIIYGEGDKVKTFKENKELMQLYKMSEVTN